MKRIFVAIDTSEGVRQKIRLYQTNLKNEFPGAGARWEKPEKLHLTLKFIGDADTAKVKSILEIAEKAARETVRFDLEICGTGVFPGIRKPKILWLGVRENGGRLLNLHEKIENGLEKIGFQKEKRIFRPHITIARLREKSPELAEKHCRNEFEPAGFGVSQITVYESILKPAGSIFLCVEKFDLV